MRNIAALTADIHAGRADPAEAVAEAEAAIAARNGMLNAVVATTHATRPDRSRPCAPGSARASGRRSRAFR
jgi:Asp-tRNA(Asn)/Glu-tRNA(Gln) amidotransferase A subunit family amidase